jgi:hypothetical protein
MEPIGFEGLYKIDQTFQSDVESYVEDNDVRSKTSVGPMQDLSELTPREFFDYYLKWNGLINWTNPILELLEQLGWKPPQVTIAINTEANPFGGMSQSQKALAVEVIVEAVADHLRKQPFRPLR